MAKLPSYAENLALLREASFRPTVEISPLQRDRVREMVRVLVNTRPRDAEELLLLLSEHPNNPGLSSQDLFHILWMQCDDLISIEHFHNTYMVYPRMSYQIR